MSGKDEDLGSFKIGDMRRPEVRSFNKEGGAPPPESEDAGAGVGFPSIERRLEESSIEEVAEELRGSYEQLEALAQSGNMKQKAGAKKAMVAYEKTADLLEHLFMTKETLQNPPAGEE